MNALIRNYNTHVQYNFISELLYNYQNSITLHIKFPQTYSLLISKKSLITQKFLFIIVQ